MFYIAPIHPADMDAIARQSTEQDCKGEPATLTTNSCVFNQWGSQCGHKATATLLSVMACLVLIAQDTLYFPSRFMADMPTTMDLCLTKSKALPKSKTKSSHAWHCYGSRYPIIELQ